MFTSPLATKRRWHSPSPPDQMPVIDREVPFAREGQLEGDLEELTTPELLRSAQPELRDSQVDSMGSFPAAQADLRDSQMSAGDSMGSFPAAHPDLRDSQMNSPGSSAEQMPSQMVSHAEEPHQSVPIASVGFQVALFICRPPSPLPQFTISMPMMMVPPGAISTICRPSSPAEPCALALWECRNIKSRGPWIV